MSVLKKLIKSLEDFFYEEETKVYDLDEKPKNIDHKDEQTQPIEKISSGWLIIRDSREDSLLLDCHMEKLKELALIIQKARRNYPGSEITATWQYPKQLKLDKNWIVLDIGVDKDREEIINFISSEIEHKINYDSLK